LHATEDGEREEDLYSRLSRDLKDMIFRAYRVATKLGCWSPELSRMLGNMNGVLIAKILINKSISEGFAALYIKKRLDLTVEATVADNSRFHVLFEPVEVMRATNRLIECGYLTRGRRPARKS
jgi:hypothetical protein